MLFRSIAAHQEITMVTSPQQLLSEAQARLAELLRASPAADLERNLKALLAQSFQKLELVTREEFEVERERLARLQQRLEALERDLQSRVSPANRSVDPSTNRGSGIAHPAQTGPGTTPATAQTPPVPPIPAPSGQGSAG